MHFDFEVAKKRSYLYSGIRLFFQKKGFVEVETPTLSPFLIPEPTINSFKSEFISDFRDKKDFFLIPSPEVFMKELIASGSPSIFQISKCFRNNEQIGFEHNPEFSMLEYYTLNEDDRYSIDLTEEMLRNTNVGNPSLFSDEKIVLSMEEAFLKYAGFDLEKTQEIKSIQYEAKRLGIRYSKDDSWEDTFNRIFLTLVEPSLPKDKRVYLKDYPEKIECLAENYKDRPYKKRWEMYFKGIEVANCYTEETNKASIAERLGSEQKKLEKSRKGTCHVISPYNSLFSELDMKASSGVALGLDRLLMIEMEKRNIDEVLLFPFSLLVER